MTVVIDLPDTTAAPVAIQTLPLLGLALVAAATETKIQEKR